MLPVRLQRVAFGGACRPASRSRVSQRLRPRAAAVETVSTFRTAEDEATEAYYDEEGDDEEFVTDSDDDELEIDLDEFDETDVGSLEDMYAEFDKLIEGTVVTYRAGDTCHGTVLSTDRKGAVIDVGGKSAARVDLDEMSTAPISDAAELLRPGMVRRFKVLYDGQNETDDTIQLSMAHEEREIMWRRLKQMQEHDVTVPGRITAGNAGGAVVSVLNNSGFIPISHLGLAANEGDQEDVERTHLIGRELMLKFLELDEDEGRLLMSARRAESADTLTTFKIGDVVEGIVSKVLEYGAFVDVNPGGTGLLHISQISHERVTELDDLLAVGDRLKVMIMAHDRERGRLSFSTKKLEPAPGDMLRDPAKVFASAEDMAELFKVRVAAAEQAAREEEAKLIIQGDNPDQAGAGYGYY